MWKVLIYLTILINLSFTFNVDNWKAKFCDPEKEIPLWPDNTPLSTIFFCENALFTSQELQEIEDQSNHIELSEKPNILFVGSNITFNSQFFNIFPNGEKFHFKGSKINLKDSGYSINREIKYLYFEDCNIYGTKTFTFSKTLNNLRSLTFIKSAFDNKALERNLIGDSISLESLLLNANQFQINDDAFKGLRNLKSIGIINTQLKKLNPIWFMDKKNLKKVVLYGNQFREIPCDSLPENIEILDMSYNYIEVLNFTNCKFNKSLKHLILRDNLIYDFDNHVFDGLENIEEINLEANRLTSFSKDHALNLKKLKKVLLNNNVIMMGNYVP